MRGVLFVYVFAVGARCACAADATLAELTESIRDNDSLYRNLEVKYRTILKGEYLPEGHDPARTIRTLETDWRVVLQGDFYYLSSREHLTRFDGSDRRFETEYAYDGETTRANYKNQLGNISDERISISPAAPPHRLGLVPFEEFSLAAILEGRPDVLETWSLSKIEATRLGRTKWNDLDAEKIEVKMHAATGDTSRRLLFWILPERNFLVARMEDYLPATHATPHGIIETDDWRELTPGIWAPHKAVNRVYWAKDARHPEEYVHQVTETHTVDSIRFDPNYPMDLFREVDMPAGKPVYIFKGGDIVDTVIDGRSVSQRTGEADNGAAPGAK